jgi:hypothetical protein
MRIRPATLCCAMLFGCSAAPDAEMPRSVIVISEADADVVRSALLGANERRFATGGDDAADANAASLRARIDRFGEVGSDLPEHRKRSEDVLRRRIDRLGEPSRR